MRTVYTTGEVARICQVAPRTVSKWFDSGRLRGYRIPGSQDRRIPRDELIKFLRAYGLPLGELEEEVGRHKVLVVGTEASLRNRIRELLPEAEGYKYEVADSGFEAGVHAERFRPDAIIVDLAMGRHEALQIARDLRRDRRYADTLLIALANEDEATPEALVPAGFQEVFKKPFDVTLLAERIKRLMQTRQAES
jgi:excisionase family DNA binding protein